MARYGTNEVPFREEYDPRPQDPYGISKVAAEHMLRNLCEVHGVEYVIAVPHNIIGPRQKFDDPYRNVASIMINLMLQDRQPIIYSDGEQKRCFSFVEDCLGCLVEMLDRPDVVGEVINIEPDEEFITINHLSYLQKSWARQAFAKMLP
jgi:UDP-glucose 4-epimerase